MKMAGSSHRLKRGLSVLVVLAMVGIMLGTVGAEELIAAESLSTGEEVQYIVQTPYDKGIFIENGIEFHYVAGDTWQGLMLVIPDASRVFVGTPRDTYDGSAGANATTIATRYGALAAVNGAFFVDENYVGNGGTPIGVVFSEGVMKYGDTKSVWNVMGFDANNNFVCEPMTGAQALERGIRDAVHCKPILVQNGQVTNLKGASTTLMDARTAVGARADGCVLLLQIDGRMAHSIGATTKDMAECMIAFGAVSAGNLDGGGSVSNYYNGGKLPGIVSSYGKRRGPNAFCVRYEVKGEVADEEISTEEVDS